MAPSPCLNTPESSSTISVSVIETTSRIIAKTGLVNVSDILKDGISQISAIIWSHHHFDHIGDPSTFPSSTALVVGPGFKNEFLPGYPANPESWIKESDYAGREMIDQYDAVDYFGDGSFYLLDCPGHTIAHIMGLARTTPDTFVLMAADCCHHGGEFRPSRFRPLPASIDIPSTEFANRAFYELNNPNDSEMVREAMNSQRKLEEFDGSENVLVLTAHDSDAADIIDFYPKTVDDWKSKGWKEQLYWAFLHDFEVE
ncbi:hypothetical protein RBB50_010181 [Rhinocladiella similis]